MKNRRNYYRILQVQPDAPLEIIRASYRTIMRDLMQHPDFGGDHWNASIINEAYETLSDSDKRAAYDKKYSQFFSNKAASKKDFRKKAYTGSDKSAFKKPASGHTMADMNMKSGTQKSCNDSVHRLINRVKMNETPLYYFSTSKKKQEAKMLDLSPKGIRFTCSEKLTHASTIKMGCSLFKAEAEVVNFNKNLSTEKPMYSVGARFRNIKFRNPRGSFYSRFV